MQKGDFVIVKPEVLNVFKERVGKVLEMDQRTGEAVVEFAFRFEPKELEVIS